MNQHTRHELRGSVSGFGVLFPFGLLAERSSLRGNPIEMRVGSVVLVDDISGRNSFDVYLG